MVQREFFMRQASPSLSLSTSLSLPLCDVCVLPMQMQQSVEKCLRFDLVSFSLCMGNLSTRLSLSLSLSSSLPLSLSSSLCFFVHPSLLLSFPPSLCLSHTLVVQLLPLEFSSECSTRSAAAAAQLAERKTLDTNLNCSDACKLLQARAVSPPLSPPHLSPPSLPLNVVITSLPATVRANMQIARKIQFMNANAIHYSRSVFECVWVQVYVCARVFMYAGVCVCVSVCVGVHWLLRSTSSSFFCCMRQLFYQTIFDHF